MRKKDKMFFNEVKITLFYLFVFFLNSLPAQNSNLDSLLGNLSTMQNDTTKVNALHNIARTYYTEEKGIDKFEEYTKQELLLSQKLNYKRGIALAYLNMGIIQRANSNLEMATYYGKTALKLMQEIKDIKGEGNCLISIGLTCNVKGDYKEAIAYLTKAIQLEESIHEKKGMSSAYNNMAIALQNQGNYEKSMRYNLKALKISEEFRDKTGVAMSYINIGVLFYTQKKIDQALGYFLKAVQQLEGTEGANLGHALNNIGNVYLDKKQYQKAFFYYFKALKVREKMNDKRGTSMSYNNIGNVYLSQNQLESALSSHLKAYDLSKQVGDKKNIVIASNSIGNTYEAKKDFKEAQYYYTEALTVAEEIDFEEGIRDAYENFTSLYKEKKQFEKALMYSMLFKKMNDSSLNEASLRQINDLTARYETEKKEQEILLLTKDQELNSKIIRQQRLERWGLIMVLCLLSISVISIYWRYRFKQKANEILKKQKQEIEQTVRELTVARDELNMVVEQKEKLTSILAHDLRTPLRFMTTISDYLHKNVRTITTEEQEELSRELSTSSKSTFAFADELLTWLAIQKDNHKVERSLVDIRKILNELSGFFSDIAKMNGSQIKVEAEDLLLETDERLLKIILRNVIDNAIKYTNEGVITLIARKVNAEKLEIQVSDTGEGMTKEQLEKLMDNNMFGFPFQIKDKLGFQIVRDLVAVIGCRIEIESELEKGTDVRLFFLLKK